MRGYGRCGDLFGEDRVERRSMLAAGVRSDGAQTTRRLAELKVVYPEMVADLDIEIGKRLRSGCGPDG
ncbi:MAG: hypothetical protein ABS58_09295 [Mesorhizobium sp. SCN 65-20]|nr:MAG: hypothetical protein ABS58_09295 [Mesorhizobium sp. SCN 65-20]